MKKLLFTLFLLTYLNAFSNNLVNYFTSNGYKKIEAKKFVTLNKVFSDSINSKSNFFIFFKIKSNKHLLFLKNKERNNYTVYLETKGDFSMILMRSQSLKISYKNEKEFLLDVHSTYFFDTKKTTVYCLTNSIPGRYGSKYEFIGKTINVYEAEFKEYGKLNCEKSILSQIKCSPFLRNKSFSTTYTIENIKPPFLKESFEMFYSIIRNNKK